MPERRQPIDSKEYENERRTPSGSDRRVIDRFDDAQVVSAIRQIISALRALIAVGILAAISELVFGVIRDAGHMARGVFICGLLILAVGLLTQYHAKLSHYLKNESTGNLSQAMEAQRNFWIVAGIVSAIVFIASIVIRL